MTSRRFEAPAKAIANLQRKINELERRASRVGHGHGSWQNYTPQLTASTTDPSLGAGGVAQGRVLHIPDVLVVVRFRIQFGTGASRGSGQYQVSVPVNISSALPSATTMSIGQAVLFDWSVSGHKELAVCYRASATTIGMFVDDATVSHNNPFLFTDDDRFGGSITYEPA